MIRHQPPLSMVSQPLTPGAGHWGLGCDQVWRIGVRGQRVPHGAQVGLSAREHQVINNGEAHLNGRLMKRRYGDGAEGRVSQQRSEGRVSHSVVFQFFKFSAKIVYLRLFAAV